MPQQNKTEVSWKDWLIGALWIVTITLAGLGYGSIKDSIKGVHDCQTAQLKDWNDWKVSYERDKATIWRVMDKLCTYQAERLNKEGKAPNYYIPDPK